MWQQPLHPPWVQNACNCQRSNGFLSNSTNGGGGIKFMLMCVRIVTKSLGLHSFWSTKMLGLWGSHSNTKWTLDISLPSNHGGSWHSGWLHLICGYGLGYIDVCVCWFVLSVRLMFVSFSHTSSLKPGLESRGAFWSVPCFYQWRRSFDCKK